MHEVLERTTWHSEQHTRQLIVVLDSLNRVVDGRLSEADLRGLPLPENAWDEASREGNWGLRGRRRRSTLTAVTRVGTDRQLVPALVSGNARSPS